MTNGRFPAASFVDADLRGVAIDDVYLHAADLRRAAFSGSGTLFATGVPPASLTDTVLTSADLSFATLDGVSIDHTRLDEANLTNASLHRAEVKGFSTLDRAEARNASFEMASLEHTSFVQAKLQGASFRYSDVTGCDFTGADIGGADFTGARGLHPSMFLRATGTPVPPDCCGRRAPV
mmetsp:Transcript_28700/g.91968  ORF Transcript_28700/g.91968 Transcript_28700/m.91968 type:complete len:179 (-) Transcript_28700:86-622(-)